MVKRKKLQAAEGIGKAERKGTMIKQNYEIERGRITIT